MINFKKREETNGIALSYTKADMPLKEYEKNVKCQGWFTVGYHYLLHANGSIEEGIPCEQYAEPPINHCQDCICVLVMGQNDGKTNKIQESALNLLADELNLKIIR